MSAQGFIERFGQDERDAILAAATSHENGVHDNRGADEFRWALLIAIGYQCAEIDSYRDHHGITAPWVDVDAWMREPEQRAWFAKHDGDVDYLSLMGGKYTDYVEIPT